MRKFFKKLYRSITLDTRCPHDKCDTPMIPWRSGEWVCPIHDLTPLAYHLIKK